MTHLFKADILIIHHIIDSGVLHIPLQNHSQLLPGDFPVRFEPAIFFLSVVSGSKSACDVLRLLAGKISEFIKTRIGVGNSAV